MGNAKITKTSPKMVFAFSVNALIMSIVAKTATTETANYMQTYTFSNLSQRGRNGAIARYWIDALTSHELDHISRNSLAKIMHATLEDMAHDCLIHLGWRYTEHGERIA